MSAVIQYGKEKKKIYTVLNAIRKHSGELGRFATQNQLEW